MREGALDVGQHVLVRLHELFSLAQAEVELHLHFVRLETPERIIIINQKQEPCLHVEHLSVAFQEIVLTILPSPFPCQ